jgi:hypothetical protein
MLRWLFVCSAITACADSAKPAATVAQSSAPSPVQVDGVTVEMRADAPANPQCLSYCRSFGACWLNLSNSDPMVNPASAEQRCLAEQSQCRRQTADLHCCAQLRDCSEFSHCIEAAHNVVSDCDRFDTRPTAGNR